MSKVSYYTAEGLKKLRAELNHLKDVERPKASQAIGQALKRNPFPLIIPCHRVVGQSKVGNIGINQNMGGYMGELDSPIKTFLLTHEGGIDSRVEQLAS